MTDTDDRIVAIDFVAKTGYIAITRRSGKAHGMYSTAIHARQLAEMHQVELTYDGEQPVG